MSPRLLSAALFILFAVTRAACATQPDDWTARHDVLVARLQKLEASAGRFGPQWEAIYARALPWYERFGGNPRHAVDDWMTPPEQYAGALADALEQGRNYFAEHHDALIPLAFRAKLPDGRTAEANYWISLPTDFPSSAARFPLVVGLHGSGWLGHKLSFVDRPATPGTHTKHFSVTPINEGGPWQIDFLNAYLDELLRVFPIDADRVYAEGHSLGGMATWEWAMANPERFAAISPRSGVGEPYRAARLRNVPAWVIHGGKDNVISPGFAEQMVTALEACGGRVRYTLMPEVEHNMPDDLDQGRVLAWYFQQTRSHEPVPPDPRDQLGLGPANFSPWEIVAGSAAPSWQSEPVPLADRFRCLAAVGPLFAHAATTGRPVDALLHAQFEVATGAARFWLAAPQSPRTKATPPADTIPQPGARFVRFYFRGPTAEAVKHAGLVAQEAAAAGHPVVNAGELWITPLSLWPETPGAIAEYRLEIK